MLTDIPSTPGSWTGSSLPLARCKTFQSDDVDAIREHMSRVLTPHQLNTDGEAPSSLSFRHNQAVLRALTVNATDYGMPSGRVTVSVPPSDQTYFVQFSLTGTSRISYQNKSVELPPGYVCVLSPNIPLRETFDGDYKHIMVKIPRYDLEAVLAQELGYKPGRLEFSADPIPLKGAAGAFVQLVSTICNDIDAGGSAFTHARICMSIEDTLKRLLLAAIPHNYSDLFDAPPTAAAPYYVRRVEEYVREHASEFISLADMVEASGVSARSLHAGFRRFRNVTPMGYLKNYRLELARRQLLIGIDQGLTVTDIAMSSGFTHLSKFARDYYERFNERPSTTLRRLRGG